MLTWCVLGRRSQVLCPLSPVFGPKVRIGELHQKSKSEPVLCFPDSLANYKTHLF